jgi:hypothetical protein
MSTIISLIISLILILTGPNYFPRSPRPAKMPENRIIKIRGGLTDLRKISGFAAILPVGEDQTDGQFEAKKVWHDKPTVMCG